VVDRRPIRFNSDDFLVESKVKKVGLRKNEEYRLGKNSRIYLQPYKEGERSGCLLTVEILTNKYMAGLETMVDARYVAIAKILEDFKTFGRPETPKGDGAGIN